MNKAINESVNEGIYKMYRLLLDCYKSGQISERQWHDHMKDEVFKKWLEKHENNS